MTKSWIQARLFTVGVTGMSRYFALRDRMSGRANPPRWPEIDAAAVVPMTFASCGHTLNGVFVRPASSTAQGALLIHHGIGETVGCWRGVQLLLAREGVASLVYDYSGYGKSEGTISSAQCESDAVAAFRSLEDLVPGVPLSLLGFSMGSGVACAVLHRLPVAGIILCAAFTSFRAAAGRMGVPGGMMPAIWDNEAALRRCNVPVLILHGEADRLLPPYMAQRLKDACASAVRMEIFPGLTHDAPFVNPSVGYWKTIAEATCGPLRGTV